MVVVDASVAIKWFLLEPPAPPLPDTWRGRL
jgi:hypothetical protein